MPQLGPDEALRFAVLYADARTNDARLLPRQAEDFAAELKAGLAEHGYHVEHQYITHPVGEKREQHHADCYHCGRPENDDPFVVPGSKLRLELYSSETDAGRFRHWGGSDLWVCRNHKYPDDHVQRWVRTMEWTEAVDHMYARDDVDLRNMMFEIPKEVDLYLDDHAARLQDLDRSAPHGGHAATEKRSAEGAETQ